MISINENNNINFYIERFNEPAWLTLGKFATHSEPLSVNDIMNLTAWIYSEITIRNNFRMLTGLGLIELNMRGLGITHRESNFKLTNKGYRAWEDYCKYEIDKKMSNMQLN